MSFQPILNSIQIEDIIRHILCACLLYLGKVLYHREDESIA